MVVNFFLLEQNWDNFPTKLIPAFGKKVDEIISIQVKRGPKIIPWVHKKQTYHPLNIFFSFERFRLPLRCWKIAAGIPSSSTEWGDFLWWSRFVHRNQAPWLASQVAVTWWDQAEPFPVVASCWSHLWTWEAHEDCESQVSPQSRRRISSLELARRTPEHPFCSWQGHTERACHLLSCCPKSQKSDDRPTSHSELIVPLYITTAADKGVAEQRNIHFQVTRTGKSNALPERHWRINADVTPFLDARVWKTDVLIDMINAALTITAETGLHF